jgi:ribosomal protein S18 acetylase RimI-like enzyme
VKKKSIKDKKRVNRSSEFAIRPFRASDLCAIQVIRQRAFQSIFDSFRQLVGEEIFQLQYRDADRKQAEYLDSICAKNADKEIFVLLQDDAVIGFVGISADKTSAIGEIDLNAVDPDYQGKGGGRFMYDFALGRLKKKGAKLVKVGTGADVSHLPARRAYEKAGFNVGIPGVTLFRLI